MASMSAAQPSVRGGVCAQRAPVAVRVGHLARTRHERLEGHPGSAKPVMERAPIDVPW